MLLLLLVATPASAQSIEGTWDFRIDGTTIFRFVIAEGTDGEWLGEWQRPEAFNTDGNNFANMEGGVKSSPSMTGIEFLGQVELSFDDPRPGAVPDIFRFDLTGDDSATMLYVGTDLAPYRLVRAAEGDVIGDWDAVRIYRRMPARVEPQEEGEEEDLLLLPPLNGRGGPVVNFLDLTPSSKATSLAEGTQEAVAEEEAAVDMVEDVPEAGETEAEEPLAEPLIGADFLDGL